MSQRVPAPAVWVIGLFIFSEILRAWSARAFPLLDITARAPLWTAFAVGLALAGTLVALAGTPDWIVGRATPLAVRTVVALGGFILGGSLGSGVYVTGNALIDRAPVRWVPYAVAGHYPGRDRSRLALRSAGAAGYPVQIWPFDKKSTAALGAGTPVVVPVRPGAFGSPWLAGEIRPASR